MDDVVSNITCACSCWPAQLLVGCSLAWRLIETRPERPLLLTSSISASTCSSKVPTQVARSSLPCLEDLPPALNDDKMPTLCDPLRCIGTHYTLSAPIWVPARHTRHVLRKSSILLHYLFQCLLLAVGSCPARISQVCVFSSTRIQRDLKGHRCAPDPSRAVLELHVPRSGLLPLHQLISGWLRR